ncbi:MAG TPA: alpha/beta hydrolase [Drouetiella sp.]
MRSKIFSPILILYLLFVFETASFAQTNTPAKPPPQSQSYKLSANVSYHPGLSQCTGDIYTPNLAKGKQLPAVVVVHGGAFTSGSKDDFNAIESSIDLARSGFVVFDINYRLLSDDGTYPNNIIDVKLAAEYLFQNAPKYNIDRERIGVFGMSAGGYLALMAAYEPNAALKIKSPNHLKFAAAFCPITDLNQMSSATMIANYLGCDFEQNKALYKQASPTSYASTAVPTLLVHGDRDELVPVTQSTDLAEAVQPYTMVKLVRFKRADHLFSLKNCPQRALALTQLVNFFQESFECRQY